MSDEFEIKYSWLSTKGDSEVDRSFCRLQIILGGKNVTQYSAEHEVGGEHLEIPSYFLAEWVAENWWALLWEPRKSEDVGDDADFLARHSFLTAQHGFALPRILVVPAGRSINVTALPRDVQFADVRFRNFSNVWLPRERVEAELAHFVNNVAVRLLEGRLSGTALHEAWQLITETSKDEALFCRFIGALGLSPYASNDEIEVTLDRALSTLGEELTMDLCLVSTPDNLAEATRAAEVANESSADVSEMSLEPLAKISPPAENYSMPAWRRGEEAAKRVRMALGVKDNDPRGAEVLFEKLKIDLSRRIEAPGQFGSIATPISGLVTKEGESARIALLQQMQPQRRFSAARAAYAAWTSVPKISRLITQAVTRDQQASRSFAAEITAPIAYLRSASRGGRLSHQQMFELAANLNIGLDVAKKHAQNKGLQIGQM
jgi:hypothetical protein